MTNKPTLEPCPLPNCNGEAVFEHPVTEAVVRCIECGLSLTVSYDASIITSYKKGREFERGAVLAQWNTRPAPEPQGFDEWYKSLGDDPSKLGRVILPHDAYNAGYAAAATQAKRIAELEAASEYNHSPVDDEIDGVLFRFWARAGSFPGGWPYDTMRAIAYCKTPDEYRTALLKLANEKGVNLPTPPRNT